jgi:hypothetical protein
MTYLSFVIATALSGLAAVVTLNIAVDPAGIYRSDRANPASYVGALIKSERGLWWLEHSYNDRALKRALASYSGKVDCVVVGSSRSMQIGSHSPAKALAPECGTVLNLGVSGAALEDHYVLSYAAVREGPPRKIIVAVDPWLFAFGKDARWSQYRGEYDEASRTILGKAQPPHPKEHGLWREKLVNLVSAEYTVRSIETAVREWGSDPRAISPVESLDEKAGGPHPALMPDGSLVYSAKYIAAAAKLPVPLGGTTYMTDGRLNEQHAIDAYRSLLRWIKSKGVEPILLMVPYHENVWKSPNSATTLALKRVEPIVYGLGKELGIRTIGSYRPEAIGCEAAEFYDFMHPTMDCLTRLARRSG